MQTEFVGIIDWMIKKRFRVLLAEVTDNKTVVPNRRSIFLILV